MTGTILVTARSLTAAGLDSIRELDPLREAGFELRGGPAGRRPTEDELRDLVDGCVGWLAGTEHITAAAMSSAGDLRVISRYGVGVDAIDLDAAARLGIVVERAVGGNARGVAELTLGLMLSTLRGVSPSHRALLQGRWERFEGRELGECVIGIVGLGSIGRIVKSLTAPLAAEVLTHDPAAPAESTPLHELLARSDVVTLHCPPPEDGTALIGAEQLALMPTGAVLINTARSALVDDDAVMAALTDGDLAGYAVDAFDEEPPPVTALLDHPNVVATAHIGALTRASGRRTATVAVANLLSHLEHA